MPPAAPQLDTSEALGFWEVHTVKKGWAPLAPALQPALDSAMRMSLERVELLVDPIARAWVPNPDAVDEAIRRRCAVYVAYPLECTMGKVDGAPPRPLRRRSAATPSSADGAEVRGLASEVADVAETMQPDASVRDAVEPPALQLADAAEEREEEEDLEEEEDPLMFTAKPRDGFVIHSSMFERLQQGASERQAGHRYSESAWAAPSDGSNGVVQTSDAVIEGSKGAG